MKRILVMFLSMMLVFGICAAAQASGTTFTDSADMLEEASQFPFLAETDETAVNVRADVSTKAAKVGRLERGEKLTVTDASVNQKGEVWYAVTLEDGTEGYIRSDLLVKAEEMTVICAAYQAPIEVSQREYIGNRKSKKFHYPTCRTLPKESNRIYFSSREEAVDHGFDPCGNCEP